MLTHNKFGTCLTFENANIDTPPATRRLQTYSENEYLMPYTSVPISMTAKENMKLENILTPKFRMPNFKNPKCLDN